MAISSAYAGLHFNSISYTSLKPGTRVVITGAVHGNETCGTQAIRRAVAEIETGQLQLDAGAVTFIPVCNPLAYKRGTRAGDRNLNRKLIPTSNPLEFEDHVANWLCPVLGQHQVLLDLHSFSGDGEPFVLIGPENNHGQLESFQQAELEQALAVRLGVHRVVDGWLSTYANGVAKRRQRLKQMGTHANSRQLLQADPSFGIGTTEYMRSVGGAALTLECGSHEDPNAPLVAYTAVINTLTHLGLIAGRPPLPSSKMEALKIYDVIDKEHVDDKFSRNWSSFDELRPGDLIGWRYDGEPVLAQTEGRIIFPDPAASAGEEWFYLTRASGRL